MNWKTPIEESDNGTLIWDKKGIVQRLLNSNTLAQSYRINQAFSKVTKHLQVKVIKKKVLMSERSTDRVPKWITEIKIVIGKYLKIPQVFENDW